MSNTPRTDAQVGEAHEWVFNSRVVPEGFARELELENAKLRALLTEVKTIAIRYIAASNKEPSEDEYGVLMDAAVAQTSIQVRSPDNVEIK